MYAIKISLFGLLLLCCLSYQALADPKAADCLLPLETGRCDAAFERYGYDSSIGKCVKFIYGGCDANANNFSTMEECEKACMQSSD